MFSLFTKLSAKGVLGINRRNADFTLYYNERKYYPLVDDKRRTKELAIRKGVNVPELYSVIEMQHQIENFVNMIGDRDDFVIKPSHGSGGNGIMVVAGRRKDRFLKTDDTLLMEEDIKHHLSNVISGVYSLSGISDSAIIEYRIKPHSIFDDISYRGVPDIRIIVFCGIPVMTMLRLPTTFSKGRANLHQGAIGAGINVVTGVTTTAVFHNEIINEHPDTGFGITGINIPDWQGCLELASKCYDFTALKYVGVDLVIDKNLGPLMLELNARPGLSIQLANKTGLADRLEKVLKLQSIPSDIPSRLEISRDLFSSF